MDVAKDGSSEGDRTSDHLEPLTRQLATRLHSRAMMSAYKYKLMSTDEDGMAEGGGRRMASRSGHTVVKVVVAILVLAILALAVLLGWAWKRRDSKEVCLTPQCVDVSAYIMGKMNSSVDPCVDFYTYSCGGWESNTLPPPERSKYDTFAEIYTKNRAIVRNILEEKSTLYKGHNSSAVAKLKLFYQTCMDVDKIEADGTGPILKKIEELGGWSLSPGRQQQQQEGGNRSWDLVSALTPFFRLGMAPLFSFYLSVDARNNSQYLMVFCQSGLTLSTREEYLKDAAKFKDVFMSFAVKVGKLLGGDNSTEQKMEAIYKLEKSMAEIFMDKEAIEDPVAIYNIMTVAEFQKIIGDQVGVGRLMSGVLHREVTEAQRVQVVTVDYFRKLGAVLAATSPQVLQDYLVWHMVQVITGYLPQRFVDAALGVGKAETGVTSLSPRWQRCMAKAEAAFGFASSALYIDKHFPPESKAQAKQIAEEVRAAFVEEVGGVGWMDGETRGRARRKAVAMETGVGYPDWLLDPARLDLYFTQAHLEKGEFLNNFFRVSKYEEDRKWAKLGTVPDREMWGSIADEPNAFFRNNFNMVLLHAGLLQRPYFDRAFPLSFAYGAMGMIAGHELTHGFDNHGRKYNEKGNLEDWWSAESSRAFQKHAQCMARQYSAFTVAGTPLNGNYTLGENIADNGGLKLGYLAYLKARARGEWGEPALPALTLTPQQLFFVGFAQIWCAHYTPQYAQHVILTGSHAISKFRVHGSVANTPEFAQAFNCPSGAPLNPAHRCQVW